MPNDPYSLDFKHCTDVYECLCCHLTVDEQISSPHHARVCRGCARHQGGTLDKLRQRDSDHVGLWTSTLAVMQDEHAEQVAAWRGVVQAERQKVADVNDELEATRSQLMEKYREVPDGAVARWLDSVAVQAAREDAQKAYKARDAAMRTMWHVNELHHAKNASMTQCSCGKATDHCKVWNTLEPERPYLDRWEKTQIERLEKSLPHGLPRHHPKVREYRDNRYLYRG